MTNLPTIRMPHEPGIYYFMGKTEYHADPALGSTDLRAFMKGPRRYWRTSWMNPNAEDRKSVV